MIRSRVTEITSLKIVREGQFLAKWTSTATKCGPETAQPIYEYTCTVECLPSLDPNGFVLDNQDIHAYFVKTYGTKPLPAVSCERMAIHAVKTLVRKCISISLAVTRISVSVSGTKGAWLTAEFVPGGKR